MPGAVLFLYMTCERYTVCMRKASEDAYVSEVMRRLIGRYSDKLQTELVHRNITELFVAVLLSPQCSDKQVNVVTKSLFKKYSGFEDYANADLRALKRDLSGLNYYKTKARNLRKAARMIMSRFDGEVPRTIDQLMELHGVGRKVANVILNEGFGISEHGIAIDTHCITVSRRLGLTRHKTADRIELDLMRKVPKRDWKIISNLLIALGRDTCTARTKFCGRCVLKDICPSSTERNHATSTLSSG